MEGSATFTMVESSTIMRLPRQRTISASQRLRLSVRLSVRPVVMSFPHLLSEWDARRVQWLASRLFGDVRLFPLRARTWKRREPPEQTVIWTLGKRKGRLVRASPPLDFASRSFSRGGLPERETARRKRVTEF